MSITNHFSWLVIVCKTITALHHVTLCYKLSHSQPALPHKLLVLDHCQSFLAHNHGNKLKPSNHMELYCFLAPFSFIVFFAVIVWLVFPINVPLDPHPLFSLLTQLAVTFRTITDTITLLLCFVPSNGSTSNFVSWPVLPQVFSFS